MGTCPPPSSHTLIERLPVPLYATPAQLAEYLAPGGATEPPSDALRLLRLASGLVGHTTRGAVYQIDQFALPVDVRKLDAMQEATVAQAAAWLVNGIDPDKGRAGEKGAVASKSAGGASITYALHAADVAARSDLASGDVLCGHAWRVLDQAGLLSTSVQARW